MVLIPVERGDFHSVDGQVFGYLPPAAKRDNVAMSPEELPSVKQAPPDAAQPAAPPSAVPAT
ncbi:MAG TPA: hypothetical protein VN893_04375, partial [Bryobacteraceae bacterium]|nr:hypothetical protein [Bryobacteraceae bacterium]